MRNGFGYKLLYDIPPASKGIIFEGFSWQRENFLNMCMYSAIQVNKGYGHDKQKSNLVG